ncbi:MAG: formate dehydrogenase accessory sulfurtransferase FdhD [Parasporobacterium sp.]|nr:formate dehydrogenase accessory sulfurtransferase FdhD [Parasporobacterium sp.]
METAKGKTVSVLKWKESDGSVRQDIVAEELILSVYVNGRTCGVLRCSPWEQDELIAGYLFINGIIRTYEDICKLECAGDKLYVTCSERKNHQEEKKSASPQYIKADEVISLMAVFSDMSDVFRKTGGAHSAAVSDGRSIITFTEDVSRHNALYRLAGRCLRKGISFEDKIILFSGRVPEEIMSAVIQLGCSTIISVSAPTSAAVEIAGQNGVMLICFARGDRFNVYTCFERLIR